MFISAAGQTSSPSTPARPSPAAADKTLQVADRPLGPGEAVHPRPEPLVVAGLQQVGELVDEHVIEHPRGHVAQALTDPDRAVGGRAGRPARAHRRHPAQGRRDGPAFEVAARQLGGAAAQRIVTRAGGRAAPRLAALQPAHHLVDPAALLRVAHPPGNEDDHRVALAPGADHASAAITASDLDDRGVRHRSTLIHAPDRVRSCPQARRRLWTTADERRCAVASSGYDHCPAPAAAPQPSLGPSSAAPPAPASADRPTPPAAPPTAAPRHPHRGRPQPLHPPPRHPRPCAAHRRDRPAPRHRTAAPPTAASHIAQARRQPGGRPPRRTCATLPAAVRLARHRSVLPLGAAARVVGLDPETALVVDGLPPPLAALLDRLDRPAVTDALVAEAAARGVPAEIARGLLAQLVEAGALVDAAAPARAARARTSGVVGVCGRGPLAVGIVTGLLHSGIGTVHTDTGGAVRGSDLGTGYADADRGGERLAATQAAVRRLLPERRDAARRRCGRAPIWSCSPTRLPSLRSWKGCARSGVAHLAVRLRDGVGVVGPLVYPGRTACLGCLDLTRGDLEPRWPAVAAQLAGRAGVADPATATATVGLAVAQAVAAIEAREPGHGRAPRSSSTSDRPPAPPRLERPPRLPVRRTREGSPRRCAHLGRRGDTIMR